MKYELLSPAFTVRQAIEQYSKKRGPSLEALIAQLLSLSSETHRRPDLATFLIEEGRLIDPYSHQPVNDLIKKENPIQEIEKSIFERLENYLCERDGNIAIWISPKDERVGYAANKICVYIREGNLVYGIFVLFEGYISPTLRGIIFKYNEEKKEAVPDLVSNLLNLVKQIDRNREEKLARIFAQQIQVGVSPSSIISQMKALEFIGPYPISCAPSYPNLFSPHKRGWGILSILSRDFYGDLEFKCPHCSMSVKRPYGQLLDICPHCKKSVRCF